jgi:hypothetical protein
MDKQKEVKKLFESHGIKAPSPPKLSEEKKELKKRLKSYEKKYTKMNINGNPTYGIPIDVHDHGVNYIPIEYAQWDEINNAFSDSKFPNVVLGGKRRMRGSKKSNKKRNSKRMTRKLGGTWVHF